MKHAEVRSSDHLVEAGYSPLFHPFIHNVEKWPNILEKSCGVHTSKSFKYIWPFFQYYDFLSNWVFFHKHSRFTRQQGKGETISLAPVYHLHPLHWYLGIGWAITVESSLLHIASSRIQTEDLWFPSASRNTFSNLNKKMLCITICFITMCITETFPWRYKNNVQPTISN